MVDAEDGANYPHNRQQHFSPARSVSSLSSLNGENNNDTRSARLSRPIPPNCSRPRAPRRRLATSHMTAYCLPSMPIAFASESWQLRMCYSGVTAK